MNNDAAIYDPDRLSEWLVAMTSRPLEAEEREALNAMLRHSHEARAYAAQWLADDAGLMDALQAAGAAAMAETNGLTVETVAAALLLPGVPVIPSTRTAPQRGLRPQIPARFSKQPMRPALGRSRAASPRRSSSAWLAWAAVPVMGGIAAAWWMQTQLPQIAVATLAATEAAHWESPSDATWSRGKIARLQSGHARFDFANGARVVVEGPAALEMVSGRSARLLHGTAVCEVGEKGHGFQLRAGDLTATDLGTAFGLKALPGRPPEVHVLDGKVSVSGKTGAAREVNGGFALRQDGDKTAAISLSRRGFERAASLLPNEAKRRQSRTIEWAGIAQRMATDDATVLYHPMQPRGSAFVPLRGTEAMNEGGLPTSDGRWPGEAAVSFRGDATRLTSMLEESFDAITLLVWVKLDRLPAANGGLLIGNTARNGSDTGIFHWGLAPDGTLSLARKRGGGSGWDVARAPRLVASDAVGEWLLLTTTSDTRSGEIIHYLNGREAARDTLPGGATLRLGRFGIGNSISGPAYGIHGTMAELLVSRRVWTAEEIAAQYRDGRP